MDSPRGVQQRMQSGFLPGQLLPGSMSGRHEVCQAGWVMWVCQGTLAGWTTRASNKELPLMTAAVMFISVCYTHYLRATLPSTRRLLQASGIEDFGGES